MLQLTFNPRLSYPVFEQPGPDIYIKSISWIMCQGIELPTLQELCSRFSIKAGDRRNSPATSHDFAAYFDRELHQMWQLARDIFLQNTAWISQHLFIKHTKNLQNS